jgi:hypothetical protein
MFHRVIDLGCGDGRYYPDAFPTTENYVGIDVIDHSTGLAFQKSSTSFILSPALLALDSLRPTQGDLIVSIFSAHHLGQRNLRACLLTYRALGAEYLVVDARLMSEKSFRAHYLSSLLRGLWAMVFGSPNPTRIRPFLISQLQFLTTWRGYAHAITDYQTGLQRETTFSGSDNEGSYGEAAALWWAASGPIIERWMLVSAS